VTWPSARLPGSMRLIGLAIILALSLCLPPLAAEAQPAGKVYLIGSLRQGPEPASGLGLVVDAMRELGWIEGQNFRMERRNADRTEQLAALAVDLVRLKVDLMLTAGTPAAHAAKNATNTIPIVFSLADDPVESGLVASFARPGGNLTGFALGLYDEKLLEILKEALPEVSRVAIASAAERGAARTKRLSAAARALGVELQSSDMKRPSDFDSFFMTAKRRGADAALVLNVAWFRPHLGRIGLAASKGGLPAIGYAREFAESGGLLSYGPALFQNVPRLAIQIDKILKGARPADLPVEQPTKFDLTINVKTAKALGITIPQTLLLRADHVIE
jgi:putative tryptophan/tyrosine transport system substrate-binding protein